MRPLSLLNDNEVAKAALAIKKQDYNRRASFLSLENKHIEHVLQRLPEDDNDINYRDNDNWKYYFDNMVYWAGILLGTN